MRYFLEFLPVWLAASILRWLPRRAARALGQWIGWLFYRLYPRLGRVGRRNLELAFPEKSVAERERILRGVYRTLGWLLAEVPRLPDCTLANVEELAIRDGFENFLEAERRGRGVIFLTAHLGGWEIGSFVHSLHGHWLNIVVRDLDNPLLDRWIRRVRSMHGNQCHDKDSYARGLLAAMRKGETVGILMDTNMTPPQGIFADFFGIPACTASGIARVAMRTGAAVLPVFAPWDEELGKYRICYEPALETIRSGDDEADVLANTQNYNQAIERAIRRHPEQWLWLHRRWKTRPAGEPSLY